MPTTRPRHMVTETDAIAAAIDRAAQRWPQDAGSRKQLLLRLIEEGASTSGPQDAARAEQRREAIARMRGQYPGLEGAKRLQRLRAEWPD